MKNDTIHLEAARDKNRIKVGIYTPGDVIWHYEVLGAPLDRIEKISESAAEALNHASRRGSGGAQEVDRLKAVGRRLCDELLTPDIKEKLRTSHAQYLILKIDDHLVHIPWELLCVDDQFLCQRFSMGRLVKTRQKMPSGSERKLHAPLNMWIVANPEGDLEVAGSEGIDIFNTMLHMNQDGEIVRPHLDAEISPEDVRERIKSYDFVHFAGHAEYSSQSDREGPGQSGWKLDSGNFTVRDIDKMAGGAAMPAFVFSNACQSARTQAWEWKEKEQEGSFGLANAFLCAGVKHYLGTFWEIMDEPGSHFAHAFYELLRNGMPVGRAVREARRSLIDTFGSDTCWPSYILYGDPRTSYFALNETSAPNLNETSEVLETSEVFSGNTRTRGSFFNYSLNTARLREMRNWLGAALIIFITVLAFAAGNYVTDRISLYEASENRKILIARADEKQKRTDVLFDKLRENTEDRDLRGFRNLGGLSRGPMTMAMVFDSRISLADQKTENLVAFAIQSQLVTHSRFKMLERKSFDVILQELIWSRPKQSGLLMPKLLLFLEVYDDKDDQPLVLMRLVDKNTGAVVDNLFELLDRDKAVFSQKTELSAKLLEKLRRRYPLRGVITEITDRGGRLNIGDNAGVRMGQWFSVVGRQVFLKVTEVEADTCVLKITKGNTALETGWEVRQY